MSANEMKTEAATTLAEAREWLTTMAGDVNGAACPCCDRFDKIYDRKINATMVRDLIGLYRETKRHGDDRYHHYRDFMPGTTRCGDFGKLRFIGLLEQSPTTDPNKKTNGLWRITEKGIAFVEGRGSVRERVVIYHDAMLEVYGPLRSIYDFWPDFSYSDLMSRGYANAGIGL